MLKASNLHPDTFYRLSVQYADRLECSEFSTFTDASGEFVRAQRLSNGATKAVIEQIRPDGDNAPVARWER